MNLNFINAKMNDFEFIYNAICNLENNVLDKENFKKIFEENLLNQNILYFIVKDNNTNVGFISIYIQYLLHHSAKVAEIQELWVDEKNRSMGYGKTIIKQTIDILKEKGIFQLEVSTGKERERTQKFYKSQKFAESHYKYVMKL